MCKYIVAGLSFVLNGAGLLQRIYRLSFYQYIESLVKTGQAGKTTCPVSAAFSRKDFRQHSSIG